MWVVYDHPKDHPDHYVARLFMIGIGLEVPSGQIMRSRDLPTLREALADLDLTCLPRNPSDDPVIIESWV